MFDYSDQVILITGAGSARGIGRTIARFFGELGGRVIICDIDKDMLNNNTIELRQNGIDAESYFCDLTNIHDIKNMVSDVINKFRRIDVLINNAGISQKIEVSDMTIEDMQRIFSVNMYGLFLITKEICEVMKKQKYGRIVNISSVSAKRGGGIFGGAHYSASKAAVLGFSKNLAREVSQYGITVNSVCPGLINTDIWSGLSDSQIKSIIASIPIGRIGEPEDVAAAVVFLASKEAAYITGEEIDINGGSHMD